ncbi:hypothetical protein HO173_001165 [Letharia columbiana]|uniref:Flavin reductase like domain-containing protein n=1 Tax=Letharia columbiana TaxID=112416 RepID=A0A8H6G4W8_9LECA|nr:uncharacterized protein HO173_001165 [Letharia columbiana]KAF6240497.1 hypothetical protein HO173_001165 [Letharia columbiana]
MTTRHGFSSAALRLLRRPPPSASYGRSFSASRHLKEQDPEENDPPPEKTDYDYRKPSYAARRNFPAHIRHLMRSTPNPLTVITSRWPPQQSQDDASGALGNQRDGPAPEVQGKDADQLPKTAGLLVSSFNTVTLTPKPYVSFNIRLPSSTYFAIKASCEFTASGLKDARVADAFVKRKVARGDPYGESVWHGLIESDGRLKEGMGGTWWMRCRLLGEKCVEVGDHVVVVAKVVESGGYEGGEGIGLVYAEGGYRKVGDVVGVDEEKADG